ncbi:MAG: hypothetical protein ACLFR8_00910 [Alkalispirochaeta sp.]
MDRDDDRAPVSGRLFCFSLPWWRGEATKLSWREVATNHAACQGIPNSGVPRRDACLNQRHDGSNRTGTNNVRRVVILVGAVVFAAFSGCSSAEPEILQGEIRINAVYRPEAASITEELQIQSDLFDPDGLDEIDELRLYHERDRLLWRASREDLRRHSLRGEEWFAFTASAVPGSPAVPRGTFRIEVADLSGREAIRTVTIPVTLERSEPDDFAALDGDTIVLPPGVDKVWVILRAASGEPTVHALAVDTGSETRETPRPGSTASGSGEVTRIAVDELDPPLTDALSGSDTVWLLVEVSRYLMRTSGPW